MPRTNVPENHAAKLHKEDRDIGRVFKPGDSTYTRNSLRWSSSNSSSTAKEIEEGKNKGGGVRGLNQPPAEYGEQRMDGCDQFRRIAWDGDSSIERMNTSLLKHTHTHTQENKHCGGTLPKVLNVWVR